MGRVESLIPEKSEEGYAMIEVRSDESIREHCSDIISGRGDILR